MIELTDSNKIPARNKAKKRESGPKKICITCKELRSVKSISPTYGDCSSCIKKIEQCRVCTIILRNRHPMNMQSEFNYRCCEGCELKTPVYGTKEEFLESTKDSLLIEDDDEI